MIMHKTIYIKLKMDYENKNHQKKQYRNTKSALGWK